MICRITVQLALIDGSFICVWQEVHPGGGIPGGGGDRPRAHPRVLRPRRCRVPEIRYTVL